MPSLTIGLVGASSSGMWVPVEVLKEEGFKAYYLSDRLRERTVGLPRTRETWGKLGCELRSEHGNNFLARVTAPFIWQDNPELALVDSIRHPAEVDYFRNWFGAAIFGLNASAEVRYQLMLDRNRGVDPLDWEDFRELDKKDRGIGENPYAQVDAALKKADLVFNYDGNLKLLEERARDELIPWVRSLERNLR